MSTCGHAMNVSSLLSKMEETKVIRELSETAVKIALHNFNWRFMTMVYLNSSFYFGTDLFLKSYRKAVVIGRGKFYPKFAEKVRQYVLFENYLTNIVDVLTWMQYHEFDNTGKFVIVCLDVNNCNEAMAMEVLWKYKVTNVVFLKSVDDNVSGFTYFPLNNTSCIYDEPVQLVNLSSCLNSKKACHLYPMKLYNLNGCPLTVSTFIRKPFMQIENGKPFGTDGDLLSLIAEKLNSSLKVMTPKFGDGWGMMDSNCTWSGSLADVYYDYVNFSITSAALTLTRFTNFQLSTAYSTEIVIWVAPTAKKVPSSLKLSYPFQENARIALTVSFAVVVLCSLLFRSKFFNKCRRKFQLQKPRNGIVFNSWMICMGLGLPTTRLPKKTALLYIVNLWLWYCILVRTFYQVSLITAMKTNYYYEEFKNIEGVIQKEYPFGGGAALKDYYIDYPLVYKKWKDIETQDIVPTFRKIAQGMEFVLAMSNLAAKTIIWEEKIKVNVLPHKVASSPAVLFFKKYSPLAAPVNKVLEKLQQSGFTAKFFKDYAPTVVQKSEGSVETIKLEHYTGCYALLIAGWIVSFLLFISEVIIHKILYRNTFFIE